jgi:hypothetical protein
MPFHIHSNKLQRKVKGQSRMDNPESLATLGTQAEITEITKVNIS